MGVEALHCFRRGLLVGGLGTLERYMEDGCVFVAIECSY